MIAGFVGRFQPFHLGHLWVLLQLLEKYDKILVIIGSTNKSDEDNWYSFATRKQMIEQTAQDLKLDMTKIEIVGLPDIDDDNSWVAYLEKSVPDFDVMWTNSEVTFDLFSKHSSRPVRRCEFLNGISATLVRERLAAEASVKGYVPRGLLTFLEV